MEEESTTGPESIGRRPALGDGYPAERGVALGILAEALANQDNPDADQTFKLALELIDEHGRRVEKAEAFRAWARYLRKSGRDRAAQLTSSASRAQSFR